MNEQQPIEEALRQYGRRVVLQEKLNRIHDGLDLDAVRDEARPRTGRIRQLWYTHRQTLAVAASVAIFTTFATLFLANSYRNGRQQEQQYSLLRREIQAVRQSQSQILKGWNARARATQGTPGQVAGTGFMLTADGYLVTNNHIVQGADSVYVISPRGDAFNAKIVHSNPGFDLAILQIRSDSSFRTLPPVPYGFDRRESDLGERVFTLGFPRDEVVYGEGYLSSGTGYRSDSTTYQVAISVNPGNSGGPLLDERGNVIGIISGKQVAADGVSFAIKTDFLRRTLQTAPGDSLSRIPLNRASRQTFARLSRKDQIKEMKKYVFLVKVFKHN